MTDNLYLNPVKIGIGEAVITSDHDGKLIVSVVLRSHPDAPRFPGDAIPGCNFRYPSAPTMWNAFLKETGLVSLFADRGEGLMRASGCIEFHAVHVDIVHKARVRFEKRHPDAKPGFNPSVATGDPAIYSIDDATLARLIWLDWWMSWSFANCKISAIYNA